MWNCRADVSRETFRCGLPALGALVPQLRCAGTEAARMPVPMRAIRSVVPSWDVFCVSSGVASEASGAGRYGPLHAVGSLGAR